MNAHPAEKVNWLFPAGLGLLFLLSLGWLGYGNFRANGEAGLSLLENAGLLVVSSLLLAVPVGLFYLSIYLLVRAYLEKRRVGAITGRLAAWLYRTPRIAGILIAVFVGLFALDVFGMDGSVWLRIGAFLLHALPAIVLGALVALAWWREWVGAAAFLLAALYFLRFTLGGTLLDSLGMLLLFSGPMAAVGALFWANWLWKKDMHPGVGAA